MSRKWNTRKKTFERIVVTGLMFNFREAFNHYANKGWRCTRSGPQRINVTKVDTKRFKLKFEREIPNRR